MKNDWSWHNNSLLQRLSVAYQSPFNLETPSVFWVSFNVKSGFVTELTKKAVPNGTVTKERQTKETPTLHGIVLFLILH